MGVKKKKILKEVNTLIEFNYRDSGRRILDVRDILTFKIINGVLFITTKYQKELEIDKESINTKPEKAYDKIREIKEKLQQEQLNDRKAKITSI